jgi:hypothetical protein
MFRKFFIALIAVNLFACPFFCGAKSVEFDGEPAVQHCCRCNKCAQKNSEQAPNQPCEDSQLGCQCICGGAVVDDAAVQIDGCEWHVSAPLTLFRVEQTSASPLVSHAYFTGFQPDDGMNKGRAMRQLFMSLIC